MRNERTHRSPARGVPLLAGAALLLAGCDVIEDLNPFEHDSPRGNPGLYNPQNTRNASSPDYPIVIEGRWMVMLVSEANTGKRGKDYNDDSDFQDGIALIVNMRTRKRFRLNVAATNAAIIGDEIFVVIDEQLDSRDWDLDGQTDDRVLMHWTVSRKTLLYVATLSPDGPTTVVKVADRVYFADDPTVLLGADSTINYVTESAPTVPVRIQNADPVNTSPWMRIQKEDEEMLLLYQSEPLTGFDLNGDGDTTDEHVLALLDTTDPAGMNHNVGLAMEDFETPTRARNTAANDWLVAFLVNEEEQGDTNLNDPGLFVPQWQPTHCSGLGDTDTDDNVLHYLHFAAWVADPVANPPRNTGLVGVGRVLAVRGSGGSPGTVATLSEEIDEGGCSLNGDEDDDGTGVMIPEQFDTVLRYTEAFTGITPVVPQTDVDHILAVRDTSGGTAGVAELDDRIVAVIDEGGDRRNYDFNPANRNLVAWLDASPGAITVWNFDHSIGSQFFVATQWLAETQDRTRLLVTVRESTFGVSLNSNDNDTEDSIATVCVFNAANPNDLDFPGPAIAVMKTAAGMEIAGDHVYYRVGECEDSRDWNRDGDRRDLVLLRSPLANLRKASFVTTLNRNYYRKGTSCSLTGGQPTVELVETGDEGAAFLADEETAKKDYNKDGDKDDRVVRWFRL
jgi:hypothetical protein